MREFLISYAYNWRSGIEILEATVIARSKKEAYSKFKKACDISDCKVINIIDFGETENND